jgi:hypothetical protein
MSDNTSRISLNVIFHVTILFTILAWLFMLYISKITSSFINDELSHIISHNFNNILYTSDNKPISPSISLKGLNDTITINITNVMTFLIQTEIDQLVNVNPTIQNLYATNKDLKNQLIQVTDDAVKQAIQKNINYVDSEINININNIIKNFPFDYYINIFKNQDTFRQMVNQNLFNTIKIINVLLVIFLIFFIFISLISNTLSISDVSHVFLENVLTFMCVGVIEFWFFKNIAFKYVPSGPSILYTSFFSYLNNNINDNILKI